MKNFEAYFDELTKEEFELFSCSCCKCRLGYDPCEDEDKASQVNCGEQVELNKTWLLKNHVNNDLKAFLRNLKPNVEYIAISFSGITLYDKDEHTIATLTNVFETKLFDDIPKLQLVKVKDYI